MLQSESAPTLSQTSKAKARLTSKIEVGKRLEELAGFKLIRKDILSGFVPHDLPHLRQLLETPQWELKVFISSTFTDTMRERNILLDEILPDLQHEAAKYGIDITFVDMRFGVRDESTFDHLTWMSEKYGYRPLPKVLPQNVLDDKLATLSDELQALARHWYRLDLNALPPQYVLRNLVENDSNEEYWNHVLPTLRTALEGVEFDRKSCPGLKVGASITEWETRYALSEAKDNDRCCWFQRMFQGGIFEHEDPEKNFSDAVTDANVKEKLDHLRKFMKAKLSGPFLHAQASSTQLLTFADTQSHTIRSFATSIFPLSIAIKNYKTAAGDNSDDKLNKYLNDWRETASKVYFSELYQIREARKRWEVHGDGMDIGGDDLEEILHHYKAATIKCSDYVGREELITSCLQKIREYQPNNQPINLSANSLCSSKSGRGGMNNIALSIIGVSGSGKTALMSMIAMELSKEEERKKHEDSQYIRIPVIIRYCGTSKQSGSGFDLLKSICQQVQYAMSQHHGFAERRNHKFFKVDTRVKFEHLFEGKYCNGIIKAVNSDGSFEVHSDDGDLIRAREDEYEYLLNSNAARTERKDYFSAQNRLEKGIKVEVDREGRGTNFSGTIRRVHHAEHTYDIDFDDGGFEREVKEVDIRSLEPAKVKLNVPLSDMFLIDGNPCAINLNNEPQTYYEAVTLFQTLLQEYGIILLIDSLDQLSDDYQARSQLSFLRDFQPHPDTKIIVSALPDEKDSNGKWIYCYGCDTRLRERNVPRVVVPLFKGDKLDEAMCIMKDLLLKDGRVLPDAQWTYVMEQVAVEPTALYLRLAVKVISHWRSYFEADQTVLKPSVKQLIHYIFDQLERNFGVTMVRASLAYISFSQGGLTDQHIQDLLSLDDQVIDDVFQYSKPAILRIPLHVWLRVKYELEGLLIEKENNKLHWYHRQLKETVCERYSAEEIIHYHRIMATYFAHLADPKILQSRLIAPQLLSLNGVPVWFSNRTIVNRTRCEEAIYHLVRSQMWAEAIEELCNLENICAHMIQGIAFDLMKNLVRAEQACLDAHNNIPTKLQLKCKHFLRWLGTSMHQILSNPPSLIFSTATKQPEESMARKDAEQMLDVLYLDTDQCKSPMKSANTWMKEDSWVRGRAIGEFKAFSRLLINITGHPSQAIHCVCFSKDAKEMVSAGDDGLCKMWDTRTGECLTVLQGHGAESVVFCDYSADNNMIVSMSSMGKVVIWNSHTYLISAVIDTEILDITCCKLHPSNLQLVLGAKSTVHLIDLDVVTGCTGAEDQLLRAGSDDTVCAVDWLLASTSFAVPNPMVASGWSDGTILLMDIETKTEVMTLSGHTAEIVCMAICLDGTKLVSASQDKSCRVWNWKTGAALALLAGHSEVVRSLSCTSDGSKIASCSVGGSVVEWDARSYLQQTSIKEDAKIVAYDPSNRRLVSISSISNDLKVWDLSPDVQNSTFVREICNVTAAAYTADESRIMFAVSSAESKVLLWNKRSKSIVASFDGHLAEVCGIVMSKNGKLAASWDSKGLVIVYELRTLNVLGKIPTRSPKIFSVLFLGNSLRIINYSWMGVDCWDFELPAESYLAHNSIPDYPRGIVSRRDIAYKEINKLIDHERETHRDIAVSSDGTKFAVTMKDSSIHIFENNEETGPVSSLILRDHDCAVTSIIFSHDGLILLVGTSDRYIRLWNIGDPKRFKLLMEIHQSSSALSFCFGRNGQTFLSGLQDGLQEWEAKQFEEPLAAASSNKLALLRS